MRVKTAVKRLLGESNMGRIDFLRNRGRQDAWAGPFNDQRFRQCIFSELAYLCEFDTIVETGTFHGSTTAMFAATSLEVHSVEISPRNFAYAKARFCRERENLHLYCSDSRPFLGRLSQDASLLRARVFFYLDAHWGDQLPLREELEIIFSKWEKPIVMIDDFRVPHSDYAFDDYGPDRTLNLSYVAPIVKSHELSVFFPAEGSAAETGARRGSVVLCNAQWASVLDSKCRSLIRHSPQD